MSNTNTIQAIVTKKVIYEVKFSGVPAKELRETLYRAGLSYQRGQWGSVVSDSGIMGEEEVKTFFTGQQA